MLCGDFNARTGCHNSDFIINDDGLSVPVPSDYLPDSHIKHMIHTIAAPTINLENNIVKVCKQKRRNYKSEIIGNLEKLHDNDPKSYWKLLENLKNEETVITEPPVSASEWVDHFSNLNTIHERFNGRVQEISSLLEQQETISEFCEIDFRININILFDAAMSFKSNKVLMSYSLVVRADKENKDSLQISVLKGVLAV